MKTFINNSIKIFGIGHPDTKTIFDINDDEEKLDFRYKNLELMVGRTITIHFKYSDSSSDDILNGFIRLVIPQNTELEIKDFITNTIQTYLNEL